MKFICPQNYLTKWQQYVILAKFMQHRFLGDAKTYVLVLSNDAVSFLEALNRMPQFLRLRIA
jgi:hypothetical protein